MPDFQPCRELAASRPGSVWLEGHGTSERSFLFTDPVEWVEARHLGNLPGLFTRLGRAQAEGLWAAGYISYECGYGWEPKASPDFQPTGDLPLAAFGLYRAPQPCPSHGRGFSGEASLEHGGLAIGPEAFIRKVEAIHRWIERGDTYQANLTDQFRARFTGGPAELFTRMMEAQPVPFGALLRVGERAILSASPELFFHLRGREITVRPMKGTAPRGRDTPEDVAQGEWLAADSKNRAENIMIVDLLRSDLGRIAETGSVQVGELFAVERFPSLLQMTSTITATLRPEIDLQAIFASLFPSGSIVGAPKVRTMQILRDLERCEREVYTGAIGFVAPHGEAVFNVAIRTAVLECERLSMGVGAGITYDSQPASEYAELQLKCAFLSEEPFRLIETLRWEAGACALLDRHLARLQASAAYFGFPYDEAAIQRELEAQTLRLSLENAWKLRFTLGRDGGLQWSPPERVPAENEPLRVLLWPEPVDSGNRFLRHKTTRRAVYDRALHKARKDGFADALFHNERGVVTEGAIHNVVARHGSRRRTPPLDAGVLPGVFRAHLLATMPELVEEELTVEELLSADEVWLLNAVRGLRVLRKPSQHIVRTTTETANVH